MILRSLCKSSVLSCACHFFDFQLISGIIVSALQFCAAQEKGERAIPFSFGCANHKAVFMQFMRRRSDAK